MSLDPRQLQAQLSNIPLQQLAAIENPPAQQPYQAATFGPVVSPSVGPLSVAVTPLPTIQPPSQQTIAFLKALNQQYTQPTSSNAQFTVPNAPLVTGQSLPPEVLQRLTAVIQGHPVQTGLAGPQPSSYVLNTIANGKPKQTLSGQALGPLGTIVDVAKDVWNTTGGSFVHTLQAHPEQALLQAGEALGTVAGLAILGAAAPELAIGVAVGLGALAIAHTLPTTIQATLDEVQHPSDQNLARLLVGMGGVWLSVSPFRGFKTLALSKASMGTQLLKARSAIGPGEMTENVLSGTEDWRTGLKATLPVAAQMKQLPLHPADLESELKAAGLDQHPQRAVQYLVSRLRQTTQAAHALEGAANKHPLGSIDRTAVEAELKKMAETDLSEYRKQFGFRFGYRPEYQGEKAPGPQPMNFWDEAQEPESVKAFQKTPEGMQLAQNLDREWRPAMAMIQQAQELRAGIDRPDVQQVMEQGLRGMANNAFETAAKQVTANVYQMAIHAGVRTPEDWTAIRDGLEDNEVAKTLTPQQHLFANRMAWLNNAKSVGEVRHGFVELPLAGRVIRVRISRPIPGVEPTPGPSQGLRDGVLRRKVPVHRIWKASMVSRVGDSELPGSEQGAELALQQKYGTSREFEQEQARLDQAYEGARPLRDYMSQNQEAIRSARITQGYRKGAVTQAQNRLRESQVTLQALRDEGGDPAVIKEAEQAIRDRTESLNAARLRLQQHVDAQPSDVHKQLVQMSRRELDRLQNARPGGYDLMNFRDALGLDVYRYFADMSLAGTRQALSTIANTTVKGVADQLGVSATRHLSYEVQHAVSEGQLTKNELPSVLPETAFGQGPKTGYKEILPAVGSKKSLNFQPALFARDDLADPWLKALTQMESSDDFAGHLGSILYKSLITVPKRFIFVSPAWHAFNVSGRLMAHVMQNPVVAGHQLMTAWKTMHQDPEAWAALKMQGWRDGILPAHRYNVSNHVNHLEQEMTGQYTWPGVLRGLEPLSNAYQDTVEKGFWNAVDDMQTVGYFFAKSRFAAAIPGASEAQIGMAAAEYANNLGGMVNPLYMSRLWKFLRGGVWFAPSYWASFMRMGMSAFPGAARMSHFLAQREGTIGMAVNPVRLKTLDLNVRKELIRMQRSWFMTYMASSVVAADMMNMVTSGHHMWDNPKGREFDVCFDRTVSPAQDAGGTLKSACMSSLPFFRQGADVANAIGLGHDWGFAHLLSDESWQKANAVQKGIMGFEALGRGIQRGYAGKMSTGVAAAFEGMTGTDLNTFFGQGKVQSIPRWEAMLSLVPGGYTAQQAISQGPVSAAGAAASAYASQISGIPSVYWMGNERPAIDDHAWNNYQTQRTAIQQEQLNASQELMSGAVTPYDWLVDRDKAEAKRAQLEIDTFGNSSPGGQVASSYFSLRNQYGLDDPTATQSQIFQRLQLFDDAWNKQLENADPVSKAIWWDHSRQQWTDADYLYWMSKQVKSSLEGMIDGEAGQRVFAVNQQYGSFENLPGINPTLLSNLKQQDPFYAMYHGLLKELGQTSPLGALVSAFTSPYSQNVILPANMTADNLNAIQEALAARGINDGLFPSSANLLSGQTAAGLVQAAKGVADMPATEAAGGKAGGVPEFQQQVMTPMLRKAILQAAADYPSDPNIQQLAGAVGSVGS